VAKHPKRDSQPQRSARSQHDIAAHRDEAPHFWECPVCGFLSADVRFGGDAIPCPSCGAPPDGRRVFPGERVRHLDDRIRRYHAEQENEIVVILVATFLETILEDILQRIMAGHGADTTIQAAVLDSQRAVGQRIGRLFPALTGSVFEDAADKLGYRDFPHRWRELRATRNAFIHDAPFEPDAELLDRRAADKAMGLLDQSYRLFVGLNNRFVATGKGGVHVDAHGLPGAEVPSR
jgi:rubredoxin